MKRHDARAAISLAMLALACTPSVSRRAGDDPNTVQVDGERAVLKTGPVGASKPSDATYVLVDVANRSPTDRLVTIGGALLDEGGAEVGALQADELRVPANLSRVFALSTTQSVPAARRARFTVHNALAVDYPPQVVVEGEQVSHGDLTVVAATVKNAIDRDVTAVVAAAFHAADGTILARPFTIVPLAPGTSRPVRFEGPKEAARAEVFVGQVAFH